MVNAFNCVFISNSAFYNYGGVLDGDGGAIFKGSDEKVKNVAGYNEKIAGLMKKNPEDTSLHLMSYIVVIIDINISSSPNIVNN